MKGNDAAVLCELRRSPDEWHLGLDVAASVQARTDLSWWVRLNAGRMSIYVILHRLADAGLVESRYLVPGHGNPSRLARHRIYRAK